MSFTHNKGVDMPLTPLRAFVAVGQHGNFTRAAAALGVTQGAVSRHIATLETFAGGRLFHRRGATIEFTPSGLQLFDAVKDAMSTIEVTLRLLAQKGLRHDRLKVSTSMPSFAMTVIVPSLAAYTAEYGVRIDLITSLSSPEPSDDFDVLITRDLSMPGSESWELMREELVCVGSPSLVQRMAREDRWPMIAARSRPDVIATWALGAGVPIERLNVIASYDHLFLAVTAAIGGSGLLIAPRLIVADQLSAGTLVPVDDQRISSGASYLAYVNAHSAHAHSASVFCRWLKGFLRERI